MNLSSILNIAKRELKFIFTTKSRIILLFIVPLVVYFFVTFIYSNQIIHNVPVAVYDADNTELTRTITRFADASASMEVVYRAKSMAELNELILNGDIEAAFYFPRNMTADIKRGGDSKANVLISSRNIVFGNLLFKAASEIIITVSSAILLKKFGADGMPIVQSMNLVMPFRMNKKALYNPNYNYMQYLAPGLLTVLLQMILMFAGTSAINLEFNEKKSHKGILELLDIAKNKILNIIFGKALAYVTVAIFPALLILLIVFPTMGIIVYGNTFILFLYLMFFALVSVSLGLMLSSIFLENVMALDIAFFYNSPAFVFSGFTFPAWALPIYDQFYAQLIPYTQFIVGFLKLYQMNTPFHFILPHILILGIFLFVGIAGSYFALSYQVKKFDNKLSTVVA
jgi:ABC-2 type transport system permease protein